MRRVILLPLLLSACNPTIDFEVPIEGETTIEGAGLLGGLLSVFGLGDLASVDLSTSREFQNNDVRKEQVTKTRLRQLTLTRLSGDADFDFLDTLAFSGEGPQLPKARVARKQVPRDVTTFDCDIEDVELAPYVRAESMRLTTDVSGRQPNNDTRIRINLVFDVTAEVIGK
jgi:hypothetical protein